MIPLAALALLFGYVLGSIPFGVLLTRAAGLGDIRRIGSGNIGATNVLRTGRRGLAAATLLLDGAKGAVAVLLAGLATGSPTLGALAGLAAFLGHVFPLWLGFRGGKGVATGLGVLLAVAPLAGLGCCAIWLLLIWRLRMSSAAALAAFLAAPILCWALSGNGAGLLALLIALVVVARHAGNIRRLLAGTEPRLGQTK